VVAQVELLPIPAFPQFQDTTGQPGDDRAGQGHSDGTVQDHRVQAFGLLVASSQAVNRRLRDVAGHLVAIGELLTPSR
jgi:hypothetical protein